MLRRTVRDVVNYPCKSFPVRLLAAVGRSDEFQSAIFRKFCGPFSVFFGTHCSNVGTISQLWEWKELTLRFPAGFALHLWRCIWFPVHFCKCTYNTNSTGSTCASLDLVRRQDINRWCHFRVLGSLYTPLILILVLVITDYLKPILSPCHCPCGLSLSLYLSLSLSPWKVLNCAIGRAVILKAANYTSNTRQHRPIRSGMLSHMFSRIVNVFE